MKFSIATRRNICASLNIDTDNFKCRKAPYLKALVNVLNNCTCITNVNLAKGSLSDCVGVDVRIIKIILADAPTSALICPSVCVEKNWPF